MLKIATALSAKVQDDNGTVYPDEAEWEFDLASVSTHDAQPCGEPDLQAAPLRSAACKLVTLIRWASDTSILEVMQGNR